MKGLRAARSVCCCMRLLASLRIVAVWHLRSQVRVWALTPSLMSPLGLWEALPGQTWLADWGEVGGHLACLLRWDPTRARSHIVRPLGRRLLGRPLHSMVLPRMSLWGLGVWLLLPWHFSCIGCDVPWTAGGHPSRCSGSASPVCWTIWTRSRPLSSLSTSAGGVSFGLACK